MLVSPTSAQIVLFQNAIRTVPAIWSRVFCKNKTLQIYDSGHCRLI